MVPRLPYSETYCPTTLLPSLCFQRLQSPTMLSYFSRTCQRVSPGRSLKIGRAWRYNHVRAIGNVPGWDADKYSKIASVVVSNTSSLLDLLNPQPGERILDLGCGSVELTMVLKDAGSEVVGVDVSPSMVEASKAKGLDARLCDAHDLDFKEEFDAVFSNNALQWMKKDPRQVVKNVHNALKKNGRFVAGFGGVLFTNPLYNPSEEEYANMLKSEGFDIKHISLLPRGIPVPGGLRAAVDLFVSVFVGDMDDSKKEEIAKEFGETFELKWDDEGNFILDTFIMTIAATK